MEKIIAKMLLDIEAVKLSPNAPFTWASGWKSPIYCDNRKTLSYPNIRNEIRDAFVQVIKNQYPDVEVIAGVATGAIAQGVLVAQELNLPFIYVRSSAKEHGLSNLIEGVVSPNQKVVVVEDLISTGGSSLKAVEALRQKGCKVLGLVAIFSYQFETASQNFQNANCPLSTLSNYETLIEIGENEGFITKNDIENLINWRKNPSVWK
jgi:orotate phosphoribosyltransferase